MYKEVNIEYWIYPDGEDLIGVNDVIEGTSNQYFLKVTKKRTDALGGGLYDFYIQIVENCSFKDFVGSYIEDGIKFGLGIVVKQLISQLNNIRKKNPKLDPKIDVIQLRLLDCDIYLYEIYDNGIEENFDNIISELCGLASNSPKMYKKAKEIHLPIFKHSDLLNLCNYRVKLQFDEVIEDFNSNDYFKFWGVEGKKKQWVYNLQKQELKRQEFCTQEQYDNLVFNQK